MGMVVRPAGPATGRHFGPGADHGWRTTGFVRHDFGRPPAAQAREIAASQARIAAETPRGYPATIELSGGSSPRQTRP
jgi:hypothetical protein